MQHEIMNTRDIAKYLNLHEMTIYRWLKKGTLPGFKLGGRWKTRRDILNKFLEEKMWKRKSDVV